MENLNKENFFDVAAEKFPKAFANFGKFIDDYKVSVNWDRIFNGGFELPQFGGDLTIAPKFHDIPYEMQVGIIALWFTKLRYEGKNYFEPSWLFSDEVVSAMAVRYTLDICFGRLEAILNDPNHKLMADQYDLQQAELDSIKLYGFSNGQL